MNKKSQAAMEFLMTYGWALLVVLIAIAALAFFGMLNPDRFLPDKVTVSDARIQIIPTQSNGIIIKNMGSDTFYDLQINMTNHDCKISAPNTISSGEIKRFILICNDPVTPNSRLKGDIKINYSTNVYGNIVQKTATAFYAVRGNYFSSNSLVGYWPLDSDSKDYAGLNSPGIIGGATLDTKGGKVGGAYSFDGNDYINTNYGTMTTDGSVSLWFKPAISQSATTLFDKVATGNDFALFYNLSSDGKLTFRNQKSTIYNAYSTTTNFNANSWYFVAVTWGSKGMYLYLNGVQEDYNTFTDIPSGNTNPFYLGAYTNGAGNFFIGSIDDFMIFNRALSSDEVKALYQSGR
jgi:hypothetical protein